MANEFPYLIAENDQMQSGSEELWILDVPSRPLDLENRIISPDISKLSAEQRRASFRLLKS